MSDEGLRELSLFTGAGGGVLASRLLGWRVCGYIERDPDAQAILAARVRDGILDEAPCFPDVLAFVQDGYARRYRGVVDIVSRGS